MACTWAQVRGGLARHALGERRVGAQAQVGMLLGAADREHRAVVARGLIGELHPVEVGGAQAQALPGAGRRATTRLAMTSLGSNQTRSSRANPSWITM